jgi:hypothetical protein
MLCTSEIVDYKVPVGNLATWAFTICPCGVCNYWVGLQI